MHVIGDASSDSSSDELAGSTGVSIENNYHCNNVEEDVGAKNDTNNQNIKDDEDPHGPREVTNHVHSILNSWSKVTAIPPDSFLIKLLSTRGYDCSAIPTLPQSRKRQVPTEKQTTDYDNELVWAIRYSHLEKLKGLAKIGRCMNACNRFSESIIHMACRRSDFQVVQYVLQNGADLSVVDDFGRTPLHDACWSSEPRFDVATLLLDYDPQLLLKVDVRGCSPLKYVREEHWLHWCAFLFYQKERYWSVNQTSKRKREGRQ